MSDPRVPLLKHKLHEFEKFNSYEDSRKLRMEHLEKLLNAQFTNISKTGLVAGDLYQKNIENYIGSIEIPLGIAGPIRIDGDFAKGEYLIPLATTEGTLVASTNRGAVVTNLCGGITVTSEYVGVTRAPLLRTSGISTSQKTISWVRDNFTLLASIAKTNEKFIKLLKIEPYSHGKNLWLKMFFDTDEAMGMNMATKAANFISLEVVKNNPGTELLSVSGNLCSDKKPSALNIITGRGKRVRAEATVKKEVLTEYLRTTAKRISLVNRHKVWEGTALNGGLSFNAHFANIIAAAFCATGQDLAHVVDSSSGYCTMEEDGEDLFISITLSCLMLGSIGGGTRLAKQFEAQNLILTEINSQKQTKQNRASTMAEIITASVLCAELSLHAALSSNEHIKAHDNFGRKKNEIN
jgi:hydroxymethylglutaryl-CoA reductase (NADPH)